MNVLGIVGWSGSGKTTLLTALLPLMKESGLRVSTIKHVHHNFDMDRQGKDSFRHRAAGAHEVMVVSATRWALLHEVEGKEPELPALLKRFDKVDLVIVEGYKTHPFPKIEVYRPSLAKPPIWHDVPNIVAVASDAEIDIGPRKLLSLNDHRSITAWILDFLSQSAWNDS